MGSPWKALSDDNRRRILLLLKEKDIITPTEIVEHFNFTMPGVSINLRILKEANMIKKRREKQIVLFEQKDNFRVSTIFDNMYDYKLKLLKKYVENKESNKRKPHTGKK